MVISCIWLYYYLRLGLSSTIKVGMIVLIGGNYMSKMVIDPVGIKRWHSDDGGLHRLDGPAIEYPDGDESWYINDQLHRLDGPARNHPVSRNIGWHIHGVRYYNFKDFQIAGNLSDNDITILKLKYGELVDNFKVGMIYD
jgi:hypothetical protein